MKPDKKSAIILAGGRSTRMQKDKALLPVYGTPLIEHVARNIQRYFDEIIISTQVDNTYPFLPFPVVVDRSEGQGPLMGILCGLEASSNPVNFVIACDIPEVNPSFLFQLMQYTDDYEIVVPITQDNKFEPLFAFYNRSVIPCIRGLLARGIRKILDIYPIARSKTVVMPGNDWFFNLNTFDDYSHYLKQKPTPLLL